MKYPYSEIKKSFHAREAWINVFFFKHLTVPLVYLLINYTRITPNIISIISLLLGLASAYHYYEGHALLGGGLYFFSYVFDAVDGKVARLTNSGTAYGAWLDIFIDRVNLTLISLAICWHYYEQSMDGTILALNIIFLSLAFIGSESRHQIDLYKMKNRIQPESDRKTISRYDKWCLSKGVEKEPVSLPEIFLFFLIVSPQFQIEKITLIFVIFLLLLRLVKQQYFWVHVGKSR